MRSMLLVLALVSFAASARAQVDGATDDDLDARAQVHFHAGRDYYERGDYESALRELTLAYDMSHRPELLYNLGSCHERMGHWAEAVDLYDQYLAAVPDAEHRAVIAERTERLRERAAAESVVVADETDDATTDAEPIATVAPVPAGSAGPHPAAFVVLGAGALGLATFGVLGGLALAEDGALAAECGTSCSPARASTLDSLALGADISLGVGAALAVVGVVLLFTTTDGGAAPEGGTLSVGVGPTGGTVSGTF